MKVVGLDAGLTQTVLKFELEDQILHGPDDFVRAKIRRNDEVFYLCHFTIRGRPCSVVVRIDHSKKMVAVHSFRDGHLKTADYKPEEIDQWMEQR